MNNYDIKFFLKELDNGKEVFDFIKWYEKTKFPICLNISERGGKGKTFNSKDLIRYIYEKYKDTDYFSKNPVSIWLRNLVRDTKIEKHKYLDELPNWYSDKELKFKGSAETVLDLLVDEKPITRFISLNTGESQKGTRLIPKLIVWDEFNVGIKDVSEPIEQFDSILHTTEDIVNNYGKEDDSRLLIFGNNKTLNHPLLIEMGITHISNEVTEIYDDLGNPFMLILMPLWSDEDKEKFERDNNKNWRFQFSKKIGTVNHSYFNENLYDEVNFVHQYINIENELLSNNVTKFKDILKNGVTFYHDNRYFNIYDISPLYRTELKTSYHCVDLNMLEKMMNDMYKKLNIKNEFNKQDLFSKEIYTFKTHNLKENIKIATTDYKNIFKKIISENKVSFENISSRTIYLNSII